MKVASWEAIRKDRFSLTPQGLYDELVRNTQHILTSWKGDSTRRQARLKAPLEGSDDEEADGERKEKSEEKEERKPERHEEPKLRPKDKYRLAFALVVRRALI